MASIKKYTRKSLQNKQQELKKESKDSSNRVMALTEEDIPPVFHRVPGHSFPGIKCMVCSNYIDITRREKQYAIKCHQCLELTPLRKPSSDKKQYIRCVCNCLLLCQMDEKKVICPKPQCLKVLEIRAPTREDRYPLHAIGTVQVICAFCGNVFLYNTYEHKLASCPHCMTRSSVQKAYIHNRAMGFIIAAICQFIISVSLTVETIHLTGRYPGIISFYVFLFSATVLFLLGAINYLMMKVSKIIHIGEIELH